MSRDSLFGRSRSSSSTSDTVTSTSTIQDQTITTFEHVLTTYPPILENILLHLPTPSIFDLFHVNRLLRQFLRSYPLAWKNLSFRLLPPAAPAVLNPTGFDGSDITELAELPVAFNYLLRLLMPLSTSLTRLDLDNTSVDGVELIAKVLEQRRTTLQHLSVRGCKRVSLRYHILPWLEFETTLPVELAGTGTFALKSLYVYRCRHHRRRPYLPSSLLRRDSDSRPTHQLIELCHRLGIWTDTAWCPTPGPRCSRRKDYFIGHNPADGPTEVWVPFDRLWRSQNFVGRVETEQPPQSNRGRIWEEQEQGFGGEQLGTGSEHAHGEGKEVPMHQRRSHRVFIDGFSCDSCGERIIERCEQCSVRFHCMGCRKTLCASCAFDKPIKKKRTRPPIHSGDSSDSNSIGTITPTYSFVSNKRRNLSRNLTFPTDRYWWAPGADRSPNMMTEEADDAHSSEDDLPLNPAQALLPASMRHPKLDMQWCCLRPSFSGGGGIAFVGTQCGDNVRAAPLPKGQGFEDPSFPKHAPSRVEGVHTNATYPLFSGSVTFLSSTLLEQALGLDPGAFDISPVLEQAADPTSEIWQRSMTPRSLCQGCYYSTKWRVLCGGCKHPLCIDHDVKSLKVRRCGYRRLVDERAVVQRTKNFLKEGVCVPESMRDQSMASFYGKWNPIIAQMAEADDVRRAHGKWAPITSNAYQYEEASEYEAPEATLPNTRTEVLRTGATNLVRQEADLPQSVPATAAQDNPMNLECGQDDIRATSMKRHRSLSHIPTRTRSLSTDSAVAGSITLMPPRWVGCSRYFCPSPRPPGDPRQRCPADTAVHPCNRCGIHVCDACLDTVPKQCACSSCNGWGFLCPNCCRAPGVRNACTFDEEELIRLNRVKEEEKAEAERKEHAKQKWKEETDERAEADESAVGLGEFFDGLEGL